MQSTLVTKRPFYNKTTLAEVGKLSFSKLRQSTFVSRGLFGIKYKLQIIPPVCLDYLYIYRKLLQVG